jgi:hypothetical protein
MFCLPRVTLSRLLGLQMTGGQITTVAPVSMSTTFQLENNCYYAMQYSNLRFNVYTVLNEAIYNVGVGNYPGPMTVKSRGNNDINVGLTLNYGAWRKVKSERAGSKLTWDVNARTTGIGVTLSTWCLTHQYVLLFLANATVHAEGGTEAITESLSLRESADRRLSLCSLLSQGRVSQLRHNASSDTRWCHRLLQYVNPSDGSDKGTSERRTSPLLFAARSIADHR